ncbi:sensor histidine kinase [Saccharospirillum salsuginis]|uniref:Two-component sensor histidine kinase n=1 Tax=Saccharospirillum salsuginis TaxID=418750 RepID=A0A918NHF3_9GAMM|nr:sensor histidine kinase [Saccharospirillum salsuginis]GGX73364.1 two-component sensor histidine kinase [Saccharospirillum salsuginis]
MRLLPREHVLQYDWLVHVMNYGPVIFFLGLLFEGVPLSDWAQAVVIAGAGSLCWYSGMWARPYYNLIFFTVLTGLGLWAVSLHWTGAMYLFYALVFVMVMPRVWQVTLALVLQTLIVIGQGVWLDMGNLYNSILAILILLGGHADYLFFRHMTALRVLLRSQEDLEHLTREAERERIARDLHDVLGHTLSSIALKSELAEKLMTRDPERAGHEMREVAESARRALAEVRQTVTGYRSGNLANELSLARHALEAADIEVDLPERVPDGLDRQQENVLCLVLREAVTNVVRHAEARHCRIHWQARDGQWLLSVEDDGRGWSGRFGNGLEGMRERLGLCGGALHLRSAQPGCRLEATIGASPATPTTEEPAR